MGRFEQHHRAVLAPERLQPRRPLPSLPGQEPFEDKPAGGEAREHQGGEGGAGAGGGGGGGRAGTGGATGGTTGGSGGDAGTGGAGGSSPDAGASPDELAFHAVAPRSVAACAVPLCWCFSNRQDRAHERSVARWTR